MVCAWVKKMQRDLVAEIDAFMMGRGYANRSEAIRDLTRSGLSQTNLEVAEGRDCLATLSYVYDHAARELPKRLTQEFHDHPSGRVFGDSPLIPPIERGAALRGQFFRSPRTHHPRKGFFKALPFLLEFLL